MLDKIGFKDQILKCEDLPQPQSNRSHKVSVILEAFISSICCGAYSRLWNYQMKYPFEIPIA